MKIGVLCFYPFPKGMAPTTRILAYCKGLNANGVRTQVISHTWNANESGVDKIGQIEGVEYYNTHFYSRETSKIHKLTIDKFKMYIQTLYNIWVLNRKERFDYLLISFDQVSRFIIFLPIIKLMGINLAFIADEYPEPIRRLKTRIPFWMKLVYKIVHRFFHFRILMTESLKHYYDSVVFSLPTHIMPTIVDVSRFAGINKEKVRRDYLCYMGNFDLRKDNIDNIIRAFALVARKHISLDLHLYGQPSEADRTCILELIDSLEMRDRVLLLGRVDYDLVPQILKNARILVTSQPITKRAEGGFPTKMGEYMLTENPVILTDVGEINQYVKDGINAFIVPPCQPEKYAEKIDYILENYDRALLVARKGKQYIESNFNVNIVAKSLIEFLISLK